MVLAECVSEKFIYGNIIQFKNLLYLQKPIITIKISYNLLKIKKIKI